MSSKGKTIIEQDYIEILGARVHNLQNIDVQIPRDKLVVITGVSGSGKSSLAFDTLYAEGQRRYMESFSAYARQFIGSFERPDIDKITGLSPVISIEQKTISKNPRSTVGTLTEIYDFIRLLFARVGDAYSYVTGKLMVKLSEEQILVRLMQSFLNRTVLILAPIVKGRKGHYRELFDQIRRQGFLKVRVDGEIVEIKAGMHVDRYKVHDIQVVVDRLKIIKDSGTRLSESLRTAMKIGNDSLMIQEIGKEDNHQEEDNDEDAIVHYSRSLMDPESGISYEEPAPNSFSFNSPYGACKVCNGLGTIKEVDVEGIIPDKSKSILDGGITAVGELKDNLVFKQITAIAKKYKVDLSMPINELPEEMLELILHGTGEETIKVDMDFGSGSKRSYDLKFEGVFPMIKRYHYESSSDSIKRWAETFMQKNKCPECDGARLNKESLHFKIDGKNIAELASMDFLKLKKWFTNLEDRLTENKNIIAKDVLKEIRSRINFLLNVGLDYLTLDRSARSLSGGESQRIRLATQVGSQLSGVLYILDEPTIGLHQRDNQRLINALKELVELGNTVIVVEHDKEFMLASDYILDLGPGAGKHGGRIIAQGEPSIFNNGNSSSGNLKPNLYPSSLTSDYLRGVRRIKIPEKRRNNGSKALILTGATGNNLKDISVKFPLGCLICVTGVSGSGKSSLVNLTLYPALSNHFYQSRKRPLPYKDLKGLEYIDKVIEIDQSPIGRTPRSNPATYIGVFSEIRQLFSIVPEAKIRGYKPGRFSFNVKGGRCELCHGGGLRVIEMNFLPDVHVLCEKCLGKRYNRETLEIRFKGKSVSDVLDMTVDEAVELFDKIPNILHKIKTLQDVGLGYLTLGQSSTTLSGGEAQRVKLASELAKKDTGNTFYILDEPTTGLHFEDVKVLLDVLENLISKGNTIVVIEHNMEVIKMADYVIDLGQDGGARGGELIATGSPEEIAKVKKSYTGQYLLKELQSAHN